MTGVDRMLSFRDPRTIPSKRATKTAPKTIGGRTYLEKHESQCYASRKTLLIRSQYTTVLERVSCFICSFRPVVAPVENRVCQKCPKTLCANRSGSKNNRTRLCVRRMEQEKWTISFSLLFLFALSRSCSPLIGRGREEGGEEYSFLQLTFYSSPTYLLEFVWFHVTAL